MNCVLWPMVQVTTVVAAGHLSHCGPAVAVNNARQSPFPSGIHLQHTARQRLIVLCTTFEYILTTVACEQPRSTPFQTPINWQLFPLWHRTLYWLRVRSWVVYILLCELHLRHYLVARCSHCSRLGLVIMSWLSVVARFTYYVQFYTCLFIFKQWSYSILVCLHELIYYLAS